MAVFTVENYVLRYDLAQDRPWVIFHYIAGGQTKNVNWYPPKDTAVYLADMLRNEKPVYYVENTNGTKWLTTSGEEVGEEES